jgi:hypothetical protein
LPISVFDWSPNGQLHWANFNKTRFIKLKDEGHTLFSVQFLANQLILSLLQFPMLLTLSPFFPPSLLLSLQGTFCYLFKFLLLPLIFLQPQQKSTVFPQFVKKNIFC